MRTSKIDSRDFELTFGVTVSKPEIADELRLTGFMQVRGMRYRILFEGDQEFIVEPNEGDPNRWLGRWDYNNGRVVFWTEGGECWVATYTEQAVRLARRLATRGQGAFVPFSNMELLSIIDAEERLKNPYWIAPQVRKAIAARNLAEAHVRN
jgi:hypothetical protein